MEGPLDAPGGGVVAADAVLAGEFGPELVGHLRAEALGKVAGKPHKPALIQLAALFGGKALAG